MAAGPVLYGEKRGRPPHRRRPSSPLLIPTAVLRPPARLLLPTSLGTSFSSILASRGSYRSFFSLSRSVSVALSPSRSSQLRFRTFVLQYGREIAMMPRDRGALGVSCERLSRKQAQNRRSVRLSNYNNARRRTSASSARARLYLLLARVRKTLDYHSIDCIDRQEFARKLLYRNRN